MIELDDLPLSEPSPFAQNGAHEGYRQRMVVANGELLESRFAGLLEQFTPVRTAWLSWIEPGGFVVEHIDAGPHYERWQVPLSVAGKLYQDGEPVAHEVGVPFRVHHDRWHSVDNRDGSEPRVSLVVDRDVIVSEAATPLRKKVNDG